MSKDVLRQLERYKRKYDLTDMVLSERLGIYRNYILRWRKAGRIIGAYKRIVEGFLEKEVDKQ